MTRITHLSITTFVLLLVALPVSARTWNIAADGSAECPNIRAGVDSAAAGDTLMLAPGTYLGVDNREISFGGKDIVVMSSGGADVTTIDCESSGRAFVITEGETEVAEVRGFTVTNGQWGWGGAVRIVGASPTIADNVFTANNGSRGAVIYVKDGSPIIENNLFDGNNASEYGGAMYFDGTGVSLVENNVILNNTATNGGGGIYCVLQSPDIIGNLIHNNTAMTGGGIQLWVAGSPLIAGNTIVENTSAGGAGIAATASEPTISECIIAFNGPGSGIACQSSGDPLVDCTVLFGNVGGDDICGTDMGDNLFVDPMLCGDLGSGDYTLQSGSPCVATNNACGIQIGVLGVACTTTATEPTSWGQLKARYR